MREFRLNITRLEGQANKPTVTLHVLWFGSAHTLLLGVGISFEGGCTIAAESARRSTDCGAHRRRTGSGCLVASRRTGTGSSFGDFTSVPIIATARLAMLLLPPVSPLHLPTPAVPVRLLLNHLMPLLPPVYQLPDMLPLPCVPSVVSVWIAVIGIHEQSRCATEGPDCTSSGSSL